MENKLIKPVVQVGTSAGVILPKAWLNGTAVVKLIEEPSEPSKDIFKILNKQLPDIKGIYLTGSYARREQDINSDIDIFAITEKSKGRIKKGKYDIILIPYKDFTKVIKQIIFPIIPMLRESKTILNENLIKPYLNLPLNQEALNYHLDMIKSAIKVNKEDLKLAKELNEKKLGNGTSYSLILRLRELYILDCIKKNKLWSKKEFLSLVKKITGTKTAYEGYIQIKKGENSKKQLPIVEAENLIKYIDKEVEKWEST